MGRSESWWRPPSNKAWLLCGVVAMAASGGAFAKTFTAWGPPVNAESLAGSSSDLNTAFNDGCPILSPYDESLYMASNRSPGGQGDLDIWIAPRSGEGWGLPVNAGTPINTGAQEFCPSPARGNRFYFVRRVSSTDTDIYVVKKLPKGWGTPERLPKGPGQINSDYEEWSPSWFEAPDGRQFLYFSSTRESHPTHKIYYSVDFGPAQSAQGGVVSNYSDARPNVRRDGLEIVWDSNRGNTSLPPDIWTASRTSVDEPWGSAVQLPSPINLSTSVESRPSLSWDGTMLLFGSTRAGGEGSADIYVSKRQKVTGGD